MSHIIVGAGATGIAIALKLAEAGEPVRLVTRSGSGPEHPLIKRVAADATKADGLVEISSGATTLINCAAPPYDRWLTAFPPLAAALLETAERAGLDYVMLGNIYGYGPVDGPLAPTQPLAPTAGKGRVRAQIWRDALDAHRAGRVRVTEVRASDFIGAGALSAYTLLTAPAVLAGQPAVFPGDPDVAHSWSYVGDVAATLLAVARGDGWGRAWHVPSVSTLSAQELSQRLAEIAGSPAPRVVGLSAEQLREAGQANPVLGEVAEMIYLFDRPLVLDASETEARFGVKPSPLDDVLREMDANRIPAA
jgi:nucleoside-diphosphate-sugar epimerase